jgi:hypothetical protein
MKLVDWVSPKGYVYSVPVKYKDARTASEFILGMAKEGYTVAAISKITEVRYQMVRNYLDQPKRRRVDDK